MPRFSGSRSSSWRSWREQSGCSGAARSAKSWPPCRGSETGATSIGINVHRLRVVAFTLSAIIAGVGGALYASLEQSVSPNDFNYQFSLVYVVVLAAVGVYTAAGAIEAGLAYAVLLQLIGNLPSRYSSLLALVFGLVRAELRPAPRRRVGLREEVDARPGRAVRTLPAGREQEPGRC